MESKLCIHSGSVSYCYLTLIHGDRAIVICQHSFVLPLVFFFFEEKNPALHVMLCLISHTMILHVGRHLGPDCM